ncbi:hypothetical protein BGX20_001464 [Mortierella sp. AD010]|nr:hypothetical protein BGX20_001464 [Mortierella sp. AD010]
MKLSTSFITAVVATVTLATSAFGLVCSDPEAGRLDYNKVNTDVQAALKSWNNANVIPNGQATVYNGKTVKIKCYSTTGPTTLVECRNSLSSLWNDLSTSALRIGGKIPKICALVGDTNGITIYV